MPVLRPEGADPKYDRTFTVEVAVADDTDSGTRTEPLIGLWGASGEEMTPAGALELAAGLVDAVYFLEGLRARAS